MPEREGPHHAHTPLTPRQSPEGLVLTEHFSCVISVQSPLTLPARTFTIGWNTGESSTVTYPATTAVRAADGTVTITSVGAVTDGLGEGQVATQVTVEPNLDVTACATTGLSATDSLTNTLVIAPA
ncbi:hypothetical protein AQJ30_34285 [Streptomyces longwoodensis]|uniref:Uncharacterized protein n=1 Tax=Streptomyces longwoodensis TaxID=68231 RepID=A0A101QNQ5_9ACTN|nr:hypothetical protein [Streptomyces longwoodensis]KUN33275.1 hypothetical protein AQJ30_34285 [Streptomyces longwoodensis]